MSVILEFYQQQSKACLSSIPWLEKLQTQALAAFSEKGFPTRKDEDWKYTPVDFLQQQTFAQADTLNSNQTLEISDFPEPDHVLLSNNSISGIAELASQLPQGVLVLPLSEALIQHADLIKPYLGSVIHEEHGFHFLNTAMIHLGVFIYVPAGVCVDKLIVLSHFQDQTNQALHLRHLIVLGEKSEANVVEDYRGDEAICYLTNTLTEIHLADYAKLTHYKIQRESKAAYHLGHIAVKQQAHSQFASHSFSFGGKLVRSDIGINLEAEHAFCLMNGIYAPTEGQHMDHHTTVNHLVPDCKSEQDYKGILKGKSRGVFNGKVKVAKDAQHTDAKQQNKNILLSANAEINTKPQLEIFADDVVCSHGATVGQLDEEALFYLATRGIDKAEAANYLIHAFSQDNVTLIPHKKLAEWVASLIAQQVG